MIFRIEDILIDTELCTYQGHDQFTIHRVYNSYASALSRYTNWEKLL